MSHKASSALAGADRTTTAVPVPVGASATDIAVVGLFIQVAGTINPPDGTWVLKYDSPFAAAVRLAVYAKRLSAADTGVWNFTHPQSWTRAVAGLWSGRSAVGDGFTDDEGAHSGEGAASIVVPSIAAAEYDDLVGIATSFNDSSWTPPGGMTERQDPTQGITLASEEGIAAGATGARTFTPNSSSGLAAWLGTLAAAPQSEGTKNASAIRAMGRF